MSLLLDALKKAEKAKEEAQRRAKEKVAGDAAAEGATGGQSPLTKDAPSEEVPHVRTRDELPDISQPLEIASDDLSRGNGPHECERGRSPERHGPPPCPNCR